MLAHYSYNNNGCRPLPVTSYVGGRNEFLPGRIFVEAKTKTFRKVIIAVSLIFAIPACSHFSQDENISPPVILADCFVDFHLTAWHDLDGNGFWDPSEPALEGVIFRIDGQFASMLSKYPGISNEDGYFIIRTWAPGECAARDYTITAVPPESYEPTTPTSITFSLTPVDFSSEAQFGFHANLKESTD